MRIKSAILVAMLMVYAPSLLAGTEKGRFSCLLRSVRTGTAGAATPLEAPAPVYFESPIKKAGLGWRILSHSLSGFTQVAVDPLVLPVAWRIAKKDRALAREGAAYSFQLRKNAPTEQLSAPLPFQSSEAPLWKVDQFKATDYGSQLVFTPQRTVDLSTLELHFEQLLGANLGQTAKKTIQALNDFEQVQNWMKDIKNEMRAEMRLDQLNPEDAQKYPALCEYYLDLILARHSKNKGFHVGNSELPANLYTFNSLSFFPATLGQRKLFVDWTGTQLESSSGTPHFSRGHLLQMAYAADHVPGFVELMRHTGNTMDKYGLWSTVFDNAGMTESPFWGGYWVRTFRDYLGIRY